MIKMTLKICWNCGEIYNNEFEYCKCLKSLYEQNSKFECVKCCGSMIYRSRCNHRERKKSTPKKILSETPNAIENLYLFLKKIAENELRLR